MYGIIENLWAQLNEFLSREPFLYQPLQCRQEAIIESRRIGNIEPFHPGLSKDCRELVWKGWSHIFVMFQVSPECIAPKGLLVIPPLQNLFSPGVTNCWGWGYSVTFSRCIFVNMDAVFDQGNLKGVIKWQCIAMSQYLHTTCSGLNSVSQRSCLPGTAERDLACK